MTLEEVGESLVNSVLRRPFRFRTYSGGFIDELCLALPGGYPELKRRLWLHNAVWWAFVFSFPIVLANIPRIGLFQELVTSLCLVAGIGATILSVYSEVVLCADLYLIDWPLRCSRPWRYWLRVSRQVISRADLFTDAVFVYIARSNGSFLWWASVAGLVAHFVVSYLLLGLCFGFSDCDRQLPERHGFLLLDFKILNAFVLDLLQSTESAPEAPALDDASLPQRRPVVRVTCVWHIVCLEQCLCLSLVQLCVQCVFVVGSQSAHTLVWLSILLSFLNIVETLLTTVASSCSCMRKSDTDMASPENLDFQLPRLSHPTARDLPKLKPTVSREIPLLVPPSSSDEEGDDVDLGTLHAPNNLI